jgi:hypothetical protein
VSSTGHLVKRFFGSLRPGGPGKDAEAWVASGGAPGGRQLNGRLGGPPPGPPPPPAPMPGGVERTLGNEATAPVLAAALLHDVGKADAGLRTYGRVIATISAKVAGPEMAQLWVTRRGFTRKVGLYLLHPDIGGDQLALADSDPLTVAWAREHHLPEDAWSIPVEVGRVLKSCDDD